MTTVDRKLQMTFVNFSTGQFDYIHVGDGEDFKNQSTRFFVWSGVRTPPQLLSDANTVWITFSSDSGDAFNGDGFALMVTSVPSTGRDYYVLTDNPDVFKQIHFTNSR